MIKSKYNNKKVFIDGIKFDSKMESEYYLHLLRTGVAKETIKLQPSFVLFETDKDNEGKTLRKMKYTADFQIGDVVIDIKGMPTPVFAIKKAIFKRKFKQYKLSVLTKAPKWTGVEWIELDELKKLRKERK